jgi:hypothetical protein
MDTSSDNRRRFLGLPLPTDTNIVNPDLAALLRAGCKIEIEAVPSMLGPIYAKVIVTPKGPTAANLLLGGELGKRFSIIRSTFSFHLVDGEGWDVGWRCARLTSAIAASTPHDPDPLVEDPLPPP